MTRNDYILFGAKTTALRGEQLPQTKLTVERVREIKRNPRGLTARQLAEQENVHYRTIEKIRHGQTWSHVQ